MRIVGIANAQDDVLDAGLCETPEPLDQPVGALAPLSPGGNSAFLLSGGRDRADRVQKLRADGRVRVPLGGRWFNGAAAAAWDK